MYSIKRFGIFLGKNKCIYICLVLMPVPQGSTNPAPGSEFNCQVILTYQLQSAFKYCLFN